MKLDNLCKGLNTVPGTQCALNAGYYYYKRNQSILHTVACHHGSPPQRHRPSVSKIQYCVRFTRDLICYAAATREPVSQQNNGRVGRRDQQPTLTTPNPRPPRPCNRSPQGPRSLYPRRQPQRIHLSPAGRRQYAKLEDRGGGDEWVFPGVPTRFS